MLKVYNLALILLLSSSAYASAEQPMTRYDGKYSNDQSVTLKQRIAERPLVESTARETDSPLQGRLAAHSGTAFFEIFDAWVELSGDQDEDGFYHHIKVSFDADTDTSSETVYAKLYLSYEGGDWYQLAESELFEINLDSADDSYEVLTELVSGYASGYYEVLIELHSLYHPGIVASRTLDTSDVSHAIPLEDLDRDSYDYHEDSDHYDINYGVGVSGSFSWAGILLLMMLVLIKLRFYPAKKETVKQLR